MLKQVGLLTAGAQPWNADICAGNEDYFAYCATLAIYIYRFDHELHEYHLSSIMCEHKKTITSIKWSPNKKHLFMSVSIDQRVIIYDVYLQQVITQSDVFPCQLLSLEWYPYDNDTISILSTDGKIYLWKFSASLCTSFHSVSSSNACIFKWNKKVASKFCVGNTDGSITIVFPNLKPTKSMLSTLEIYKEKFASVKDKTDSVIALEWDPLSVDYILVSTEAGIVRLIDTDSQSVIMLFQIPKQEQKIRRLCWLESAPGMFLTGDINSGMLRLWSVANESPILNHKVKETGFHCIHVIDAPNTNQANSPSIQNKFTSSSENYAIPAAKVISVFRDGGVGVYELKNKRWLFLRDKGHVETIFDCAFHPDDPDLLATASFDGTVKIWDITTMLLKHESPGNLSIIYSITWAPGDLNIICVATSKNGVLLWNIKSNQIVKRFTDHGNKSVYHCSWNYRDMKYFASVGGDGNCIIHTVDAKLTRKFSHPMPVYGCDWNPKNRDLIATACEDGIMRVFYLSSNKSDALKSFKGHTAKIFSVKWCPLKDGILCTGSDDKTIRIWDYCQDECLHCLEGHTAPVRGLLWNPEIPNILLSGGWDYSLKVWDTRTGYCLSTSQDHAADVYGLSCHHQRPFLIASTSRDSTLRMWTLQDCVKPLYCMLLSETNKESQGEEEKHEGNKVWNEMSGNAKTMIESKTDDSMKRKLHLYSHMFLPPFGVSNMWLLVSILQEKKKVILPDNYDSMIMHSSHIKGFKESKAKELETARASFKKIMGPKKREQLLTSAAEIYLQLGDLMNYCEIMIELNKWEKAICVAPGVSYEYWKKLVDRYATVLHDRDDENTVTFSMATHDYKKVCEYYMKHHQHHEAMITALVASDDHHPTNFTANGHAQDNVEASGDSKKLYIDCNKSLSETYLQNGSPCLAACCYLSVDDVDGAVRQLLRGNELELAYSLIKCFNVDKCLQKIVTCQLARRCERYKMWYEATSLLQTITDNEFDLLLCCSRYPSEKSLQRNAFYKHLGLPSVDEFKLKGDKKKGDKLKQLLYLSAAGCHDDYILRQSMKCIMDVIGRDAWHVDDVIPFMQIIGSVKQSYIQQLKKQRRLEILALSAYFGALKAIQLELHPVVVILFQHASSLLKSEPGNKVLELKTIHSESEAWIVNKLYSKSSLARREMFCQKPTEEQINIYENLMIKCAKTDESDKLLMGDMLTAYDRLPSHCHTIINYFDKTKIKGPCYVLEDGVSTIPLNIALMWSRVNMFSPLSTGDIINPF